MHQIEPYYHWRELYVAADDERSPFYGREYSEMYYTNKIYNYYIHPQWDEFESETLYTKILYADYDDHHFAILEMLGEWNDAIGNDVMFLYQNIIEPLIKQGIYKFILIMENVLNFHASDDAYYEQWYEDLRDDDGWICCLNVLPHVATEMHDAHLQYFINFDKPFLDVNWRPHKPVVVFEAVSAILQGRTKQIRF